MHIGCFTKGFCMPARRSLTLLLLMILAVGWLVPTATEASPTKPLRRTGVHHAANGQFVPNQLIVGLRAETSLARRSLLQSTTLLPQHFAGLSIKQVRPLAPDAYALTLPDGADVQAAAAQLASNPSVRFAEPNYIYDYARTPNDPLFSFQYAPALTGLTGAWDISTGSNGVVVAVIDTGITFDHPDLVDNILPGYNFVEGDDDPTDDVFHGTFVSGIIAAPGDNGLGVAGACWRCRILPIRSLGARGGTAGSVAQGIRYAVDRGARIINMSLGGALDSTLMHDAVNYALSKDVLIVAAAGNEALDGNPVEYPAAYPGVLSVGATDGNDQIADFSTHNAAVAISAPGVNIASTANDQDLLAYGAYDGTSFSSPAVAGIAALMLSVNPSLTANQVKQILTSTARDLGAPGRDEFYGAGRVDARRAVEAALNSPFSPIGNPNQPGVEFFAETGHTLRGALANFWHSNGGLEIFGFPISEEFDEQTADGTFRVQYFERNRLELHGENKAPYNVLLGRLGDTALLRTGRDWHRFPIGDPSDTSCRFFIQTGHSVCGPLLTYWEEHGLNNPSLTDDERSLQLLGLPLSEAQEETNSSGDTVILQWFERARLELHPEQPEPYQVLLGLIGSELARPVFGGPTPTPAPAPFDRCAGIPASVSATITPSNCMLFGTVATMTISGFQPGEKIAYWLTDPSGEIIGGSESPDDLLTAKADGTLDKLTFATYFLAPGTWYWVFEGQTSHHQSIIYFRIIDG